MENSTAQEVVTRWLARYPGFRGVWAGVRPSPEDFGYRLANPDQAASYLGDEVHIYSDRINRPVTLVRILRHELLGHFFFRQLPADEREWLYLQTERAIERDQAIRATYESLIERGYSPKPDRRLCEEIFAAHAEAGISLSPTQKTIGFIRNACRKVLNKAGIEVPLSAGDIRYYIHTFERVAMAGPALSTAKNEALSVHGSAALRTFQARLDGWVDRHAGAPEVSPGAGLTP